MFSKNVPNFLTTLNQSFEDIHLNVKIYLISPASLWDSTTVWDNPRHRRREKPLSFPLTRMKNGLAIKRHHLWVQAAVKLATYYWYEWESKSLFSVSITFFIPSIKSTYDFFSVKWANIFCLMLKTKKVYMM